MNKLMRSDGSARYRNVGSNRAYCIRQGRGLARVADSALRCWDWRITSGLPVIQAQFAVTKLIASVVPAGASLA
jgi:hypothetical protein